MRNLTDRPMAVKPYTSYRYRGPYGWIMIGAMSDGEALKEAARSTDAPITVKRLQVWNEGVREYQDVED